MTAHYEESRSVPFARALYAAALLPLFLCIWIPEATWALVLVAVVLGGVGWIGSRYFVRFDGESLAFGFRHWNHAVRRGELLSARKERIGLWTFGGAGWRVGKGKIGYVRWFGPAVAVKTDVREYWLSCERPAELLEALRHAGVPLEDSV